MRRIGVIFGTVLIAAIIAGATVLWSNGRLHDFVTADALESAAPDGSAAGLDPMARLDLAIRDHDAASVESALAGGIDPNAADADGETLLNKAVLFGTLEIVEILLEHGADADLSGKNGLGPLAMAALAGHHEALDRLIQASAVHSASLPAPAPAAPHFEPPAAAARAAVVAALSHSAAETRTDAATAPSGPGPANRDLAETMGGGDPLIASTGPEVPGQHSSEALLRPVAPPPAVSAGPQPSASAPGLASSGSTDVLSNSGSSTAWTLAVQRRLSELGYYKGAIDGIAGPQTVNAIVSYQAVAGIPQNGLISQDLMSRIGARVETQ